MTAAVLKNRILQATAREFDERSYGATSFSNLLRQIPDLVELDETDSPPKARLLVPMPPASGVGSGHLRPDLWDSVLDYSSGGVYVWNGAQAVNVRAEEATGKPQLPTISAEILTKWRRDFAAANPDWDLNDWVERGLRTMMLSADLRKTWSLTLKSKVAEILEAWFKEQGMVPPADLSSDARTQPAAKESQEAEHLRRFLLRCVAVMRPAELKAIQIPASIALRAKM